MMNLLSIFGAQPAADRSAEAAGKGAEGEGAFASIMAFLRSDTASGAEAETSDLAALFAEAEEVLADPDLTDADLEEILVPMLEELAAALAAAPHQMAQLRAAFARAEPAGVASDEAPLLQGAQPEIGLGPEHTPALADPLSTARAKAAGTAQGVPLAGLRADPARSEQAANWRALAEAVPELGAALEAEGGEMAARIVSEPGVQALAARVLGLAEEIAQPGRRMMLSEGAMRASEAASLDGSSFEAADAAVTLTQRAAQPQTVPVAQAASSVMPDAPQPAQQIQVALVAPAAGTAEAAPLLQAETPRAGPMPTPSSDQILNQVRASVSDTGSIRVELKPEGMGTLEIDLVPDETGALKVTVRAEQASVLTALRADRDGLLTMLREAGHQIDAKSLSFSDLGARNPGQGQSQGQGAQTTAGFGFGGEPAAREAEPEMKQVVLPMRGGIDIQV